MKFFDKINKIDELKNKIQEEIWRLQLVDYLLPTSYDYLNEMKLELKNLQNK